MSLLFNIVPQNVPHETIISPKKLRLSVEDRGKLEIYLKAATAQNTRKAYQADIRHFMGAGGLLPATPENILGYLHQFANQLNPRTLQRRLTALKNWHVYQGFSDPTAHPLVRKTLTGIYHTHGKPAAKAPALTLAQLAHLVSYLQSQNQLSAWRDNAMLQIGFFGALRRSELVGLQWEHVHFVTEGVEILITRSKTDQSGAGQVCAIPYGEDALLCPVEALKNWQEKAGLTTGAVFRRIHRNNQIGERPLSAVSVNHVIKRHAITCQLANAPTYSGHSLRRGFATAAAKSGASSGSIMRQGRWKYAGTVQGYIEAGERFEDNAVNLLLTRQNKGTQGKKA